MSIFEIIMLLCFGFAWPFSIAKSFKSKSTNGKSIIFLIVVLAGYISGIIHKYKYSNDSVIYFYMINGIMVMIDIMLYIKNFKAEQAFTENEIEKN